MFEFKSGERVNGYIIGNNGKDDGNLQIDNIQIGDVQISKIQIGNTQIDNKKLSQMLLSSLSPKIAGLEHKLLKVFLNENCDLLFFLNGL